MVARSSEARPTEAKSSAADGNVRQGPGCRRVADRLAFQLDALAKEMAEAYVTLVEEAPEGCRFDRLRASEGATEQLLHLVHGIATAGEPSASGSPALAAFAAMANELAAAGHPLTAVLAGVHASLEVPWQAAHEELAALPRSVEAVVRPMVEGAVFNTVAASTAAVSEAYVAAGAERSNDRVRSILDDAILGSDRLSGVTHRAELAGWPVFAHHSVMVAVVERVDPTAPWVPMLLHQVRSALERSSTDCRQTLSTVRDGHVVMAEAGEDRVLVADLAQWRERAGGVPLPPGHRLLGAVGQSEDGLAGVARGYAQACRALDIARATPGARVIVSYQEVLPDLLLHHDLPVAEDLARLLVGVLDDHAAGEDLLTALEAYLECGLNVMSAAEHVGVHRHTLAARLERLEQTVGLRLSDPTERLLLELGMRAARLVGRWPLRLRAAATHEAAGR